MSENCLLDIVIPIEPVAAVRPKVTRWNTYYPGKYGKYLPEVREWLKVHARTLSPAETLLDVSLYFGLSRPKSHFGTGKNKAVVKPSAPVVPHQDVDNLAKGVMDAMSGVVYEDDKQVVRLVVEKAYGDGNTRVVVRRYGRIPGL